MSTPTDTRHSDLERRLRAAAAAVPSRPVPTDAWVELQSRLATRDGRHSRRFLAAAAVVALLLALAGGAALLNDGRTGSGPASGPDEGGADDPWAPAHHLGEPVTAETLTLDGQETRHELVLTDTDGKGPSLCDLYTDVATGSSSGGCTARDPRADDPSVAVDWLSGATGGGDIHGVIAAVDSRVAKVRVYLSNGDMVLADLRPTGWEGTKTFALTLQDDTAPGVPQRLVAYADAKGTVLQAVDLADLFGNSWLPAEGHACDAADAHLVTVGGIAVRASARELQVAAAPDPGARWSSCFATGTALAGARLDGEAVLVVAPEVSSVRLPDGTDGQPLAIPGVLWRVVVVPGVPEPDDVFLATDETGQALARLSGIELT